MVIKKNIEVKELPVTEEEVKNITRKILIGPDDGSHNIIMRLLKVLPGGYSPLHNHSHEHVVKVEKGRGVVVTGTGEEVEISQGQSLFIEGEERHQFKNPFSEPFEFLCIILNPDR